MNIKNIKIGPRLGVAFAAVLTLTGAMTGVGIWELSRVAEAKNEMKQAALKQALADQWLGNIATNSVRTLAKAKSNIAKSVSAQTGADFDTAWLYLQTGDNMLAIYAAEKALRLAERLGEAGVASRAHGIFGRVFGRIGDNEKARVNLERSVELARDTDPSETIVALFALGRHFELSQADQSSRLQKKQLPHPIVNGTTTRSPLFKLITAGPTSTTSPMNSWPRMSPFIIVGM